ncbi:MAG: hypothetical protein JXA98_04965 [Methanosarcinaceae archaeon]|nr:hypothetical protein [Methanosarcinaceae archaeon]
MISESFTGLEIPPFRSTTIWIGCENIGHIFASGVRELGWKDTYYRIAVIIYIYINIY